MERELNTVRDTVESVWVAVILAFVLRAFMIEAFVIPTGSMAPRLLGEHWQLVCPACGYDYSYGVPSSAQNHPDFDRARPQTPTGATCPNCGCTYPAAMLPDYPRSGDRVLVMKYLYRLRDPEPWDVVVFRNPQSNRDNYIKRVIGLPGERIEIVHGDVFVDKGDGQWRIRAKPPQAQKAVWQVIYDNDYPPNAELYAKLDRLGASPPGWALTMGRWDLTGQDGRRFLYPGGDRAEIAFSAGQDAFLPHYGYNLPSTEAQSIDRFTDICSDLELSAVFVPQTGDCRLSLLLSSFERRFKAEICADGKVWLWHEGPDSPPGQWEMWGRRQLKPLAKGGCHEVALAHADFRVALWLDGQEVLASTEQQYPADYNWLKARVATNRDGRIIRPIPTPQVSFVAEGGPSELWHVRLFRDVFYTCPQLQPVERDASPLWDFARWMQRRGRLADRGSGWGTTGNPIKLAKFPGRPELDQFFVLGDNSPQSLDGRCWTKAAPTLRLTDQKTGETLYQLGTVPRYGLIGKAFFVYWPAGFGVPKLPGLPILPNVGKMRLIR